MFDGWKSNKFAEKTSTLLPKIAVLVCIRVHTSHEQWHGAISMNISDFKS